MDWLAKGGQHYEQPLMMALEPIFYFNAVSFFVIIILVLIVPQCIFSSAATVLF